MVTHPSFPWDNSNNNMGYKITCVGNISHKKVQIRQNHTEILPFNLLYKQAGNLKYPTEYLTQEKLASLLAFTKSSITVDQLNLISIV